MKKFKLFAICAAVVAAGFAINAHLHTAKASAQPVAAKETVAQSVNNDSTQENIVKNKIKEANQVIVPADPARSTTPELTLEQAKALEGTITNQYEIRDDIYEYINNNVPKDNPAAIKASIKFAQYVDQIYYHSANKQEALEISKKQLLAVSCLRISLDGTWTTVFDHIDKMMRDSYARNRRMWDIDEKFFGWEAMGTGLTVSEENKRCQSGDF